MLLTAVFPWTFFFFCFFVKKISLNGINTGNEKNALALNAKKILTHLFTITPIFFNGNKPAFNK